MLAGLDYSTLQFCMRQPPSGKRLITSARQRQGHKSTDPPEGQGFRDSCVQDGLCRRQNLQLTKEGSTFALLVYRNCIVSSGFNHVGASYGNAKRGPKP